MMALDGPFELIPRKMAVDGVVVDDWTRVVVVMLQRVFQQGFVEEMKNRMVSVVGDVWVVAVTETYVNYLDGVRDKGNVGRTCFR